MHIEQFVMAYQVEQDRLRAMLPEGFVSLRPVLRINTELRDGETAYAELNTPVQHGDVRGWLNIARWLGAAEGLTHRRDGRTVTISAPFLQLSYTGTGTEGGCPAERDNDGCYYREGSRLALSPAERITANKEFCDCAFAWRFHPGDACGESLGVTLPAFCEEPARAYEPCGLSAEHAAAIPCRQVLGAYIVRFERN